MPMEKPRLMLGNNKKGAALGQSQKGFIIVEKRRLLNAHETATYLGLSKAALYQLVHRKRIPVVRLGRALRFDVVKLDDWISGHLEEDLLYR